jgi:CheY-like chemotaxis protein
MSVKLTKILLADDDLDDRWFFEDFLKSREDIILLPAATSGSEVIQYLDNLSSGTELPDVIILDHNMPGLNGKETLAHLRSRNRYNQISVLIYSTYISQKLIDDCIKLGAASVMLKPSSPDEYNGMIDRILSDVAKKANNY